MNIVVMATKNYKPILDENVHRIQKYGHVPIVHVLEDADFLEIKLSKPRLMLNELQKQKEGDLLGYLDVDAFLVDPIAEIENDTEHDVLLTYRGGGERVVNSGVYFLRANDKAKRFMEMWCDKIGELEEVRKEVDPNRLGDQLFLNRLIYSHFTQGARFKNTTQDLEGIRIRFLDSTVYNSNVAVYNKDVLHEAKIIHFLASTMANPVVGIPLKLKKLGI